MTPKVWNKRDPRTPTNAIYVGRPSPYGNPFKIGPNGTREEVIALYERWLLSMPPDFIRCLIMELRGEHLVCWCAPHPCHADVLLRFVNGPL